jgi:hypothetical protein
MSEPIVLAGWPFIPVFGDTQFDSRFAADPKFSGIQLLSSRPRYLRNTKRNPLAMRGKGTDSPLNGPNWKANSPNSGRHAHDEHKFAKKLSNITVKIEDHGCPMFVLTPLLFPIFTLWLLVFINLWRSCQRNVYVENAQSPVKNCFALAAGLSHA